jgi:hypothetical protein
MSELFVMFQHEPNGRVRPCRTLAKLEVQRLGEDLARMLRLLVLLCYKVCSPI